MRGITLEEIAEATKIGSRSLRALEQEQFDHLPGGIFNKGFVRAYARFLGIDEEQAVADYLTATTVREEPAPPEGKPSRPVPPIKMDSEPEPGGSANPPWRALVLILVVMGVAAGGWYAYNRWKAQRAAQASAAEPAPVPAKAPTLPVQAASPAVLPPPKPTRTPELARQASSTSSQAAVPILLRIRVRADAWMSITADDKVVVDGTLNADDERVIRANKRVVLDIGNAGGVEITHNGKILPPLGPEGKHVTFTITPEGVQQ